MSDKKKKNFTTSDGAIDMFFTPSAKQPKQDPPPSLKRDRRISILLDEGLKEDLALLSRAKGRKSVNDLIVTTLADYVKENQEKIKQYKKLLE